MGNREVGRPDPVHLEVDEAGHEHGVFYDGRARRGAVAEPDDALAFHLDPTRLVRAEPGGDEPRSGEDRHDDVRNVNHNRASPESVRGIRRMIEVRAGRSSSTSTGISATTR